METMELKTAILHSLDMNLGMPVVSQVELEPTDFLNTYLEKRLQRLAGSEHCRTSTTASIGGVSLDEVLKASDWQAFYEFTLQLLESCSTTAKATAARARTFCLRCWKSTGI